MKKIEEKRTLNFQSEVKGTSIVIDYRVTGVPPEDGGEVSSIYGTIKKDDLPVGSVSYDRAADRVHVSFEPFTGTTAKERKTLAPVVVADGAEIIANK